MRHLTLISLLTLVGCGSSTPGPQGPEGPQGPVGPQGSNAVAPPSLSLVTPRSVVQGTTLDVALVGFGTTWTRMAHADFGTGITVNSLTLGSPTSLVANITVTTATPGPRDVVVSEGMQSVTFKAFEVLTPFTARVDGRPAQGGVVRAVISVRDPNLIVTPASVRITAEPSMGVHTLSSSLSVVGSTVVVWFGVDADAMPGARAVRVVVSSATGADVSFDQPAAFDVAMRAPTETMLMMDQPLTFDRTFDSALVAFTPPADLTDGTVVVTSDVDGGKPQLALLDATGGFASDTRFAATQFVDFRALDGGAAYLAVVDPSTNASTLTLKLAPPFMEMEPNDTAATGNTITAPGRFTANLSAETDDDWFVIPGSAALVGKSLKVTTSAVGAPNFSFDIALDVRQGSSSLVGGLIDDSYANETATATIPSAGDILIHVTSSNFGSDPGDYRVTLTLE